MRVNYCNCLQKLLSYASMLCYTVYSITKHNGTVIETLVLNAICQVFSQILTPSCLCERITHPKIQFSSSMDCNILVNPTVPASTYRNPSTRISLNPGSLSNTCSICKSVNENIFGIYVIHLFQ